LTATVLDPRYKLRRSDDSVQKNNAKLLITAQMEDLDISQPGDC